MNFKNLTQAKKSINIGDVVTIKNKGAIKNEIK